MKRTFRPFTTRLGRATLSAVALAAIAGMGVLTTGATFTDQVTMASVSVTGGTLDVQANSGNGPNQAWTGTLSAAVTNMKPGDTQTGQVVIKNNGTLPFTITSTTTGTDASGCYGYWFSETSATGATKAAGPVNITNYGTSSANGGVVNFATSVTSQPLVDNGADVIWETDDIKTYDLVVRMKDACTTQSAAGTLSFTLNATQ